MTGAPIQNQQLFESPADWISPVGRDYLQNPPVADGRKVIIVDTDHIAPSSSDDRWPWHCFMRGHHFIAMDSYMDARYSSPRTPMLAWDDIRRQMGYTLYWANRVDLGEMRPQNHLASSRYCLANPGKEYLVYLPEGGKVDVELADSSAHVKVVWFNLSTGEEINSDRVNGSAKQELVAPFKGHAILYLYQI
jgi:hypothetical protein